MFLVCVYVSSQEGRDFMHLIFILARPKQRCFVIFSQVGIQLFPSTALIFSDDGAASNAIRRKQ